MPDPLGLAKTELGESAPVSAKLTGDIDVLRGFVDRKFTSTGPVKRRFTGKRPDAHGAFKGKFAKAWLRKRPAAVEEATDSTVGGWRVQTYTRKGGHQAGKPYKTFHGPDGRKYTSLKQAALAGFVVS